MMPYSSQWPLYLQALRGDSQHQRYQTWPLYTNDFKWDATTISHPENMIINVCRALTSWRQIVQVKQPPQTHHLTYPFGWCLVCSALYFQITTACLKCCSQVGEPESKKNESYAYGPRSTESTILVNLGGQTVDESNPGCQCLWLAGTIGWHGMLNPNIFLSFQLSMVRFMNAIISSQQSHVQP